MPAIRNKMQPRSVFCNVASHAQNNRQPKTMSLSSKYNLGTTGKIVEAFLRSKLPIIFIIASLLAGAAALVLTPREEEPQIVVPVVDVMINFPGASAAEVENLVTINLERKLWEIDGVEYIYSSSHPGAAVVTVRFYVGQKQRREHRQDPQQDHVLRRPGSARGHGVGRKARRDR